MHILKTLSKGLLLSTALFLLTACGGGSSSNSDEAQKQAIGKIMNYAETGSSTAPTLQDYYHAGVRGVTAENLYEMNQLVESLEAEDVDTVEELNALTQTLGINIIPTANAGDDTSVQVNQGIILNGGGNDEDGTITSYQWKEGSTILANTASFTYTPTTVGTHTLTLTVTDNDGDIATDSVVITVTEAPNMPPSANAGNDTSVQVNQNITLAGSGSDSDGTIVSYQWKEGETILANSASFTYTPTTAGTHTLTLTVTDDDGATATDSVVVTVTEVPNVSPSANAGSDTSVQVNQSITLTGSGSDSDGTIVSYQWREGAAVISNTASFTYTPTTAGTHTLTLTVTDDDGATASAAIIINATFDAVAVTPLSYDEYKLSPMNDADFNTLSAAQKYQVASKLYGTLFYGTDPETFMAAATVDNFISQTREMFDQPNDPSELSSVETLLTTYKGWGDGEIILPMLARLFHLNPGREYMHRWAAYILTQTILFSPAYELATVYTNDAVNVYSSLVHDFDNEVSMQWSTYQHMMSNENWRRFRSPEDNGREMLEIFLMDFNDSHVPLAAKALQNWQLDTKSRTLVITLNENTEPITNLFKNTTIFNGEDFYREIVLHPNFLPTVCQRLVGIYFPTHTEVQQNAIAAQLVASNPVSWTGLLKQIIYSKEYLLHSQKTRSFEESFYPVAKTLQWHPHEYSFMSIYKNLNEMHQATMRYKLGRKTETPLDSQSFAWYHKTIREKVMINYENNATFESWDDGWALKEMFKVLPEELDTKEKIAEHMIHALFISIIGRDASTEEENFLMGMIDKEKYNNTTYRNYHWISLIGNEDPEDDYEERGYFAAMILDYLSRISTTYTFEPVN